MDKQNICLYDWLSFTTHSMSPEEVVRLLNMEHLQWENKRKGAQGYKSGIYYGSISIFYDGREDMGVWCEMTGQGCRHFESDSDLGWPALFERLMQHKCKVNRLDIAFDDHTGILDLKQLAEDWENEEYVSTSDFGDFRCSRKKKGMPLERTLIVGSPQSAVKLRIYDKAKERGDYEEHWVRVEMQLRDGRAGTYVAKSAGNAGSYFSNVLVNYLRFVDPDPNDSNMWRWPMKPYWAKLIQGAERISLWSSPGVEYNEKKCRTFVFQHAGNAIDACLQMYGEEKFFQMLKDRPTKPNPKYAALVKEVQRRQLQEQLADEARDHLEAAQISELGHEVLTRKLMREALKANRKAFAENQDDIADQVAAFNAECDARAAAFQQQRMQDYIVEGFLSGRKPMLCPDGSFAGFEPVEVDLDAREILKRRKAQEVQDAMDAAAEEEGSKVDQLKLPI